MSARNEQRQPRMRGCARRLRVAAAVITIIAAIPGALATVDYVVRSIWFSPPTQLPPPRKEPPSSRTGPGPGRCGPYHAFRDGACRDVR
jgi:hypothetical protein